MVTLFPTTVLADGDHLRSHRKLQTKNSRLWDISEPVISYTGMQLDLVHTVRDHIRSSQVRIGLYEDDKCSISFENENYIAIDVVNDLSSFGDGSGTRQVRYVYPVGLKSHLLCLLLI